VIAVFGLLAYLESPGPIFYWQRRLGCDGTPFWICKLRSMRLDAEPTAPHVVIDNQLGLRNLHEILKVRERFRDLVSIQIVAFPQSGILRSPGTAALLDAAIAEGADLLGGLDPVGIDGDLDGHLDAVFGIAERRGVVPTSTCTTAARTASSSCGHRATDGRAGLQGRVAVSPPSRWVRCRPMSPNTPQISCRGRHRDHESWTRRCGDPAAETPARAWRGVFGGQTISRRLVAVRQRRHAGRATLIAYRANFRHDEELALASTW
jgi:cytosine deaminase